MRNIGDLRDWVELLERVPGTQRGISRETWRPLARVRGEVRHLSNKMVAMAGGVYGENQVTVTIRVLPYPLLPGLRVRSSKSLWDVTEVVPDAPLRGFVQLRCISVEMEGSGVGHP